MYYERMLPNGVTVVGQSLDGFRSVSVGIWVRTGSVDEREEEGGMTHFIEHMLFKGTQKRTSREIAAEMDGIGGILNAFTSKECTCYHARVSDDKLEYTVELLSDLVLHSQIAAEELEKEKGVVVEEINMVQDSPEDLVHELLSGAYFRGHPLAKPILGTIETVSAFSREKLFSYLERRYQSGQLVIAASGGFDFDRLCEWCERYTKDVCCGPLAEKRKEGFLSPKMQFVHQVKPIEQAHLSMALPGYCMEEEELYAASVFNNIFGGSMSSRLFQRIREDLGLAYEVYAHPNSYRICGNYLIYAGVNPLRAKEALSTILQEMAEVMEKGVSEEEFFRAKSQLRGNYVLGLESTSARMNAIGKSMTLQGRMRTAEESLAGIDRVQFEDMERVIRRVMEQKNMTVAAVGQVDPEELAGVLPL